MLFKKFILVIALAFLALLPLQQASAIPAVAETWPSYFALAYDADRGWIYASDTTGNKVDVFSASTLELVKSFGLVNGAAPYGIALSPNGAELAVAQSGASSILFLDPDTGSTIATVIPDSTYGLNRPFDIVYGRNDRLYSSGIQDSSFDQIHVIDTVDHIEVGKSPYPVVFRERPYLAVSPDHNRLYVFEDSYNQEISLLDISTDTPQRLRFLDYLSGYYSKRAILTAGGSKIFTDKGSVWSSDLVAKLGSFSGAGNLVEIPTHEVVAVLSTQFPGQISFVSTSNYYARSSITISGSGSLGASVLSLDEKSLYINSATGLVVLNPRALLTIESGSSQVADTMLPFSLPLKVRVEDVNGNPVTGMELVMTAPFEGASGVFADTNSNTTTVMTDENGIATSPVFIANSIAGAYSVNVVDKGEIPYLDLNFQMMNVETVTISGNAGKANVQINYLDGTPKTVLTNQGGDYSFTVPYNWSGTISASDPGLMFSPQSYTYQNQTIDLFDQDFQPQVQISGKTINTSNIRLIYTVNGVNNAVYSDSAGDYSIVVPFTWSGTVTPVKGTCAFIPAVRSYEALLTSQSDQHFQIVQTYFNVSGKTELGNVKLSYYDSVNKTVTSDVNGNYSFSVPCGWSGTVIPSKPGYSFTPQSKTYSELSADQLNQDYSVLRMTWTRMPKSATGTTWHTATLLKDGKVLLVGGYPSTPASELYDPETGQWVQPGQMNVVRNHHTATLLQDGRVLVAGGFWSGGVQKAAEIYNPATGMWTSTGSLNLARSWHTATLLPNGQVLVVGGLTNLGITPGAELYDPATGLWTLVTSPEVNRAAHTATLLPNGKVLIVGGVVNSTGSNLAASAELYDPASQVWTSAGEILTERFGHSAVLLQNGNVLIMGGERNTQPLSSAEIYDPVTGLWKRTGNMLIPRSLFSAVTLTDGTVLVQAGTTGSTISECTPSTTTCAEVYDPNLGLWLDAPRLHAVIANHTSTLLSNGQVLVVGGDLVDIYEPGGVTITGKIGTAEVAGLIYQLQNVVRFALSVPDGRYAMMVPEHWTGSVEPVYKLPGDIIFSPGSRTYVDITTDQIDQDYIATPATVLISGNVGVAGATITSSVGSVVSDSSGNYYLPVPLDWTGTLTPSLANYQFAPSSRTYTGVQANREYQDFSIRPYIISGSVGLPGVVIRYTDVYPRAIYSDSEGNYAFSVPYNWTGTITPSKTGYSILPASRTFSNVMANQAGQDFTLEPLLFTISGNTGLGGVTLAYSNDGIKTVTSDQNGAYSLQVPTDWSGSVTPSLDGYTFQPDHLDYSAVLSNQTGQDYAYKINQTINIGTHAPAAARYGTTFTVSATSSSGLNVTFSASGACSNIGATFFITSVTGICSVQFQQVGDSTYNPAPLLTEQVNAQQLLSVLVPADFNGDGKDDIAIFRPTTGLWSIHNQGDILYGAPGDLPVPADYNGDGKDEIAVFRPASGLWYLRGIGPITFGRKGDIPVPADYDGDGKVDLAVYRPSDSTWYLRGIGSFVYGANGDIPVAADYNGDGKVEAAVYRQSNNTWYLRGVGAIVHGAAGDVPVPADYDGNGTVDLAVFSASSGKWIIRGQGSYVYGKSGDVPLPLKYSSALNAQAVVVRVVGGNLTWYIRGLGAIVHGVSGDIPAMPEELMP